MRYLIQLIKTNKYLYRSILKFYLYFKSLPIIRVYFRYRFAISYYNAKLKILARWIFLKTESDNFYYDLTDRNLQDLISLISCITGRDFKEVETYALEIKNNSDLKKHILTIMKKDKNLKDLDVAFGRRIGWYIFVRIMKPKVVVETGVHHGVGACVIVSALMRNALEGSEGTYFGTDLDPEAGLLFSGIYKRYGKILYGDSVQSLQNLGEKIDLFINDSDHNIDYETQEYITVKKKLSENFIILGDNSHNSSSLIHFANENNLKYIFFSEEPDNHWYPGAGIGICAKKIPLNQSFRR
jgi:hypothetical protein